MQASVYLKLIAGTVPDHSQGSVDATIRLMAQEALGANQVHYVRSPNPVSGRYHYLAVPSAALASEPDASTPLAMALPGHPAHQGPGAYVLEVGQYKVAVLFDGMQMDLICNEASLVDEVLAEQPLSSIKVNAEAPSWALESALTRRNRLVERLSRTVVSFSLWSLALSGVAGLGLWSAHGWFSAKLDNHAEQSERALSVALRDLKVGSPLSRQVATYQQRITTVVRSGGWLDAYMYNRDGESFRLFVPTWVTRDYVHSLGEGVVADRDAADELLLVLSKGEPSGGRFISSRETVAQPGEQAAASVSLPEGAPVPPVQAQPLDADGLFDESMFLTE